jgi:hypothetical protein
MSFTVKARCRDGEIAHRRTTTETALREARALSNAGCYDIHIVTPEGREYHSSEFADLPRTPAAERSLRETQPSRGAGPVSRFPR